MHNYKNNLYFYKQKKKVSEIIFSYYIIYAIIILN